MQSSVSLLHDDLVALRSFIPAIQAKFDDPEANAAVDAATQGSNHKSTSIFKTMVMMQPQMQLIRRLRALADAPDMIDGMTREKRWSEATSMYFRALKLAGQVETLTANQQAEKVQGGMVSIDAKVFVQKQMRELDQVKIRLTKAMRTFLARSKLFHQTAQDDNLRVSRDVVQLLQEWKIQLEQAKDVQTSVMLSMIEVSGLRPIVGLSASLEQCSQSFAAALASLALLEDSTPELLLKQFLQLRLHTMKHTVDFSACREAYQLSPFETVNFALCEWVRSAQWTFYLIYNIFLTTSSRHNDTERSTASKTSSISKSSLSSDRATPLPLLHLVMGALVGRQFGTNIKSAKECFGETVLQNLRKPILPDFVHTSISAWLSSSLKLLIGATPYESTIPSSIDAGRTVLGAIKSGQQIAHLESSLAYQLEHPLTKYVTDEHMHPNLFAYPTSSPTWSGATTPNRSGSTTPRSSVTSSSFWTSPSSHYSTPLFAAGGMSASALLAGSQITKWKQVSNAVSGRHVDLWTTYFHNLFLHHSQYIIQSSFLHVSLEPQIRIILEKPIQRGLTLTPALIESKPGGEDTFVDEGSLGNYIWTNADGWMASQVEEQLDHAHALTPALRTLVSAFDAQLDTIMDDIRPLIVIEDEVAQGKEENETETPNGSPSLQNASDAPVVRRRFRPSTKTATLPTLRAEVQRNCSALISRLCSVLSQHIADSISSAPLKTVEYSSRLYKSMLLGRLSKALDTHSFQLRKILWQLEWISPQANPNFSISSLNFTGSSPSLNGSSSLQTSSSSISTLIGANVRLTGPKWMDRLSRKPLAAVEHLAAASSSLPTSAIQQSVAASSSFQETYHLAYSKWVDAITDELSEFLSALLSAQASSAAKLSLSVLHHGWSNVNLSTGNNALPSLPGENPSKIQTFENSSARTQSTEVLVPAQPSSAILRWLREIVALVCRAGAHNVDRYVLEYLVYRASQRALDSFSSYIQHLPSILTGVVSRDCALQLWFDIKFVFDVLSKRNLNSPYFQKIALQKGKSKEESGDLKWDDVSESLNFSKKIEQLVSALKAKLDPVEAGFYAPHITKNAKSALTSHSSSFGFLMAKAEQRTRAPLSLTPVDANAATTLACVQNAPRFASLPISTPTLASLREMQANAISSSQNSATDAVSNTHGDVQRNDGDTEGPALGGKSRQALEAAGALWDKFSEGVKGSWFS